MSLLISTTAVTDPTKNQITQSNTYIKSNHPPNIIKQIPKTIEKRLSPLMSAPFYEDKLQQSGYQQKLKYANTEIHNKRNHKRNIIWFNPPFSNGLFTMGNIIEFTNHTP